MWFAKFVEGTYTYLSQGQLLECVLAGRDLERRCPGMRQAERATGVTTPAAEQSRKDGEGRSLKRQDSMNFENVVIDGTDDGRNPSVSDEGAVDEDELLASMTSLCIRRHLF